ncbi:MULTISPECIES: hypothetical protein [unclassified Cryobacterium]|uniref:hypothetical protein n=1 Tax=unclassified Cryobacterium TaxID=2649013 RepID=UPI00106B7CDC|nr:MULTISPECIES: hypothetical protein [unclassified Cryobacterium]TFC31820.1 hypothetical protein E3O22_01425 [Cryobacterium sp. TMT2-18-2]
MIGHMDPISNIFFQTHDIEVKLVSTLFHLPGSSAAALLSGSGMSLRASIPLSIGDTGSGPGREESNDVH